MSNGGLGRCTSGLIIQFKRNVTIGIEHKKRIDLYSLFLKNKILPTIKGKAIIIEYNLQSGSNGIHNGRFFKTPCKCKMNVLSHKSIMGQDFTIIEKIINIASSNNDFFILFSTTCTMS